jgi:hypothetical protein
LIERGYLLEFNIQRPCKELVGIFVGGYQGRAFGIVGSAWPVDGLFELVYSAEGSKLETPLKENWKPYSFFKLLYAM